MSRKLVSLKRNTAYIEPIDVINYPEKCQHSMLACGVPFCRLELLPCERVRNCPDKEIVNEQLKWEELHEGKRI